MTSCRSNNRIPSSGLFPSKTGHLPAQNAFQAKAQPSLRAGAGGVGGLVAVSVDGDYYFPGYDNNGNVIGYWHEEGDLVAEYAYDAFGNIIVESGSMADFFPHRFSTKYYDAETDLYYYGYRYYAPSLGRWISRDPIGEEGGNNLFVFCENASTTSIDAFGNLALIFVATPLVPPTESINKNKLEEGKEKIRAFLPKFKKEYPDENSFEKAKKAGKIKVMGGNVTCDRNRFIQIVERELNSERLVFLGDGLNAFLSWIGPLHGNANEFIDVICVATHGHAPGNDPTGNVYVGSSLVNQNEFKRSVKSSLSGKMVIFMYCYQTWRKGMKKEDTEEDYTLIPADPRFNDETKCVDFRPFSIIRWVNRGEAVYYPTKGNSSSRGDQE